MEKQQFNRDLSSPELEAVTSAGSGELEVGRVIEEILGFWQGSLGEEWVQRRQRGGSWDVNWGRDVNWGWGANWDRDVNWGSRLGLELGFRSHHWGWVVMVRLGNPEANARTSWKKQNITLVNFYCTSFGNFTQASIQ